MQFKQKKYMETRCPGDMCHKFKLRSTHSSVTDRQQKILVSVHLCKQHKKLELLLSGSVPVYLWNV